MWCSPSVGALPVPENLAPQPASACNSLHFGSGIEENQSLGPDLFFAAARGYARAHTRDARGRFAKWDSGNPRGPPAGIPNPQRRVPDLRTLCLKPGAALALARRKPRLLRPMLAQILPPAVPIPPAERLGIDFRKLRRVEDVQSAMRKIWAGLSRGAIGPGQAARLARRVAGPRRLARLDRGAGRRVSLLPDAPPLEEAVEAGRLERRAECASGAPRARSPGASVETAPRNGERDERSGNDGGNDRRLSPGGGGSEAERGRHDLWGGRHPDHRSAAPGAERGDPLPRVPPRAIGRQRRGDRRLPDP